MASTGEKTHYDTLSVASLAAPELVRKAYRQLAQKYHPDKLPGNADAQRVMAQINEAYAVLSDPARRGTYDRWIAARQQRLVAERIEQATRLSGFAAAWPWYLVIATTAFAMLSVGTVAYKAAVPPIAVAHKSAPSPAGRPPPQIDPAGPEPGR